MKILTLFDAEEKVFSINVDKIIAIFIQECIELNSYFINITLDIDEYAPNIVEYLGAYGYIPKYFKDISDAKKEIDNINLHLISL